MTQTLALAHRPQRWADLVGQDVARQILTDQLVTNQLNPAYLFEGHTGCGKTSAARLFAKRLLCKQPDGADPCNSCESCRQADRDTNGNFLYVNGAQNKSVEFIDKVVLSFLKAAPIGAPYRIIVIDEVHAWNRVSIGPFLIFLENMPARAIVIFCTTESDKVEPAIKGRCSPFIFSRLPTDAIVDRVQELLPHVDDRAALALLVEESGGSFRQVWSVLDSWSGLKRPLTGDLIRELLGAVSDSERQVLWRDLAAGNLHSVAKRWKGWVAGGAQPSRVGRHLLDDLVAMAVADPLRMWWQKPLAVLSGVAVSGASEAWLPALMTLGGLPYGQGGGAMAFFQPDERPLSLDVVRRAFYGR